MHGLGSQWATLSPLVRLFFFFFSSSLFVAFSFCFPFRFVFVFFFLGFFRCLVRFADRSPPSGSSIVPIRPCPTLAPSRSFAPRALHSLAKKRAFCPTLIRCCLPPFLMFVFVSRSSFFFSCSCSCPSLLSQVHDDPISLANVSGVDLADADVMRRRSSLRVPLCNGES